MEMAAWVKVCLMMWVAGHQSADAIRREGTITCEIPAVKVGATATLTCRFPGNVTQDAISISKNVPTERQTLPIPMLSCDWRKGRPNCVIEDKQITFNSTTMISAHDNVVVVVVKMAMAGPSDEREYLCETPGYSFTPCTFKLDIDECISSPCENGGSCQDQVIAYTCNCTEGFTGDRCQTDVLKQTPAVVPVADCGPNTALFVIVGVLVLVLIIVILLALHCRKRICTKDRFKNAEEEHILSDETEQLKSQISHLTADAEACKKETENLRAEKDELAKRIQQQETEFNELEAKNETLDKEAQEKKGTATAAGARVSTFMRDEQLRKEKRDLQSEKDRLERLNTQQSFDISRLGNENETLRDQYGNSSEEMNRLNRENVELQQKSERLSNENAQLIDKNEQLSQEKNDLRRQHGYDLTALTLGGTASSRPETAGINTQSPQLEEGGDGQGEGREERGCDGEVDSSEEVEEEEFGPGGGGNGGHP